MRWTWTLAGLAASVLLSVLLWQVGVFGLFLFLPLPFLFAFGRRRQAPPARACPACGWTSLDPGDAFCPRDGTPLPR